METKQILNRELSKELSKEKLMSKEERFKKVAEQRTIKILKTLKLLGNCANKANYEYTYEDVRKIFAALEKELKNTKNKFYVNEDDEEEFKL